MKREPRNTATTSLEVGPQVSAKHNGGPEAFHEGMDLAVILAGLQTVRNGDFSVRLPG